jgi:hypothetical protein
MFRHFSIDPTPARIMRNRAPAVYEWVARMWNARADRIGSDAWMALDGGLPDDLLPLLARAGRRYLPALHANAKAVAEGRARYSVTLQGKQYPNLPAIPFQAWRRSVLQRDLVALADGPSATVRAALSKTGCLEWLERDGILAHRYPQGERLPFCAERRLGPVERFRLWVVGTPHHREAGEALPRSANER